uniref:Uncharacterized protein n=1 Tax=Arundo donax TaxID=35708 RepID=A0A0A9GMF1_ARUDO
MYENAQEELLNWHSLPSGKLDMFPALGALKLQNLKLAAENLFCIHFPENYMIWMLMPQAKGAGVVSRYYIIQLFSVQSVHFFCKPY